MGARRTAGVVAGVLSVAAVAAAIAVFNLPEAEESPRSSDSAPAPTAEITKQTLIDRESHDGTLGHGDPTTIATRGAGTVTRLPAEGARVTRGKWIFHLDNKPVTLLYGSLPAYRTLSTGVKGADVRQFERNLRALGYRGFTVDETYSSWTGSAVKAWQEDLDLTETGWVDPGQIVYAAGVVRVDSLSTQVGTVVRPGAAVETVTGTAPLATVVLDAGSARLARQGATTRVTLPDGKVVPGKIIKVASVVSPGEEGDADTTKIQVTIRPTSAVTSVGPAAVPVAFTAGRRPHVLAVPVAALLALAEGGYGVQVVDGTTTRTVAVKTGLFADGKVEITGDGLHAGMKVAMPSSIASKPS
jgi:peptidoglycan hydrolase-like protein with peptidoglycan-binding domain